jgi:Flp pilus assembly protein TadD
MTEFSDRTPHYHHRGHEERLRQFLSENPNDPDCHALLSLSLANRGRHREAIKEARLALRISPETALAHYVLSISLPSMLPRQGKVVRAIAEAEEAIRLEPLSPSFHAQLAHLHLMRYSSTLEARHASSAFGAARAGLGVDPLDVPCTVLLARALGKLGRFDEAEDAFSTALALKPDAAYVHANYGEYLLGRGRFDRAIASMREAFRREPGSIGYRRTLGLACAAKWASEGIMWAASSLSLIRPVPSDARRTSPEWSGDVNWAAGLVLWLAVTSSTFLLLWDANDVSGLAFCVPVSLLALLTAASLRRHDGVNISGLLWLVVPAIMFIWPERISSNPRAVMPGVRLGVWFPLDRVVGLLAIGGMILFLTVVYLQACFARKTPGTGPMRMPR